MTNIIPSLKLSWPITEDNRAYAINLLKQTGLAPDSRFIRSPRYAQLWACVHAGRLLGQDVSYWESDLETETARLAELQEQHDERTTELEAYIAGLQAKIAENDAALERLNPK